MNKKLRASIERAERKYNEAMIALQDIDRHLCFVGFRGEEPILSLATGEEIILTYNGLEMHRDVFLDYMENVGYIRPEDFTYRDV